MSRFAIYCLCLALLAACSAKHKNESAELAKQYGKRLVASYDLPQSLIDGFNRSRLVKTPSGQLADSSASFADEWAGPRMAVEQTPYRFVITIDAVALEDGPAASLWYSGWQADVGNNKGNPMGPSLTKSDAKAGEILHLSGAGAPAHFNGKRIAWPVIGLFRLQNMDIKAVRVLLVSGAPSIGWLEWLFSMYTLMVGAIMFVLWWFWFRQRT